MSRNKKRRNKPEIDDKVLESAESTESTENSAPDEAVESAESSESAGYPASGQSAQNAQSSDIVEPENPDTSQSSSEQSAQNAQSSYTYDPETEAGERHNRFPTAHVEKRRQDKDKKSVFDYEAEAAKLREKEGVSEPSYSRKTKEKKSKKPSEPFEEREISESEEKSLRERFRFDWELEEQILEALDEDAEELADPDSEPEPEPIEVRTISFAQAMQAVFGFIMLVFAIIGMVATGIKISQVIRDSRDTSEQERALEEFIMPLVACDTPTFDGASSLNEDVIITAACWDIIFNPSVYYEYTGGVYSVSYLDIDRRITKLFGPGLSYTHKTVGDTELTFEYDAESGMYKIPAYPRSPAYYPEITAMNEAAAGTELTVCYRLPITNWIPSVDTVEKTMIYTVVPTDTEYNVVAVRIGEIGESEAQ